MKKTYIMGAVFALSAAILNGTVGIFSKGSFQSNLTPAGVSFYKCLIAFVFISILALGNKTLRTNIIRLKSKIKHILLCSFLGIFVLYFFETTAYKYESVSFVVFILLGSSVLTTFIFSSILLKEIKRKYQYIGLVLLLIGLLIMHFSEGDIHGGSIGTALAAIAGIGYGLFLVFTKKFALDGDLALIWYLMLFGSFYLFLPFYKEGFVWPSLGSVPSLMGLAILPTIGGFYCTTKALNYLEANKVQFFELTEPVFATIFAFILLKEFVQGLEWLGAFFILVAIYLSEYKPKHKIELESHDHQQTL
ncbi:MULTISPECIES: DMT family transporter [Bacillus]|jgi:drug/metabolite transporter (DMT)-like permease|uniref:EamA domain-containing protein n=2 Tax=Bacillus smithii TaxID=1479 RepID=G9QH31_9BACI|nr:DMT family transporter [Bacillus smithii]AKP48308.1 Permease of the drug/metabolite transporter [Bacillus smithii]EHL79538.1 hypothetical protein HMPREF1015_01090 [Bacillus smithii 7_3_47FAA]MED0659305.1 DMT family transporter [Bacillus smithii]MED1419878.1 DMT family transporter [Bacillus smithii]MED1455381.1 DMT family transporter [Bacillus smithii]